MLKKRHFMRKIKTAVLPAVSAIMIFSMASASVHAANKTVTYTKATIDESKTGSLTIRKVISNSGYSEEGTGLADYELKTDQDPLSGVTFTYIKIADIDQAVLKDTGILKFENISAGLTDLSTSLGVTLSKTNIGEESCVTTDNLGNLVKAINEKAGDGASDAGAVQLEKWITKNGTSMSATNKDGYTSADGLPLGMYLVAESSVKETQEAEPTVISSTLPFLVMLPMTNVTEIDGQAAGTLWQYDVTVYPKNNTASLSKSLLSDDGKSLLTTTDSNMGDEQTMVLNASIPKLADGRKIETFAIDDEMDEGLSFVSLDKVTLGTGEWNTEGNETLTSADYTVTSTDSHHFTLTLTASGLEKINTAGTALSLYVFYTTSLNHKAAIGTDMSQNKPVLRIGADHAKVVSVQGNKVSVATYEIDLTKTAGKTGIDLSETVFQVKEGEQVISFVKENDGLYHRADGDEIKNEATIQVTNEISPDENGLLKIKGMDEGEYLITEIKTPSGFNLLRDELTLKIEAPSKVDGSIQKATLSSGQEDAEEIGNDKNLSDGIVDLTIKNTSAISTPHTGGSGIYLYVLMGCAVMAGSYFLFHKRRNRKEV